MGARTVACPEDSHGIETIDEPETSGDKEVGTLECPPARPISGEFCNLIMARREGDTFIPIEGGTGLRGWVEYPRRTLGWYATRNCGS